MPTNRSEGVTELLWQRFSHLQHRMVILFVRELTRNLSPLTEIELHVEHTYMTVVMPLLAKSTRDRYEGILENCLLPTFGGLSLRDLTPLSVQRYFSNMATSSLAHESRDKIRDVLSSVLRSAVEYGFSVEQSGRKRADAGGKAR